MPTSNRSFYASSATPPWPSAWLWILRSSYARGTPHVLNIRPCPRVRSTLMLRRLSCVLGQDYTLSRWIYGYLTMLPISLQSAFSHHTSPMFQTSADRFMALIAKLALRVPRIPCFATWWNRFCQDTSAWQVELIVTVFVQLLGFWLPATIYQLLDVYFPAFSRAHKHQPDPRRQPTPSQILHCIRYACFMTLGDIALQIGIGYLTDFRPIFVISPILPTLRNWRHILYSATWPARFCSTMSTAYYTILGSTPATISSITALPRRLPLRACTRRL